jgi:hypothetical protein
MKKAIKKEEIKFQFKAIELMDVNLLYPQKQLQRDVKFKFNINVEIKIINDNNLIMALVSVDIVDDETTEKFGNLKVNCIFLIENFESFVNVKTKKAEFPKQFLTTINSISISTARGLMFGEFRGTFLHNAVLPIIDPTFLEKGMN